MHKTIFGAALLLTAASSQADIVTNTPTGQNSTNTFTYTDTKNPFNADFDVGEHSQLTDSDELTKDHELDSDDELTKDHELGSDDELTKDHEVGDNDELTKDLELGNGDEIGKDDELGKDDEFGEHEAVPEPATWAMMLLGFGGMGLAMRRQRKPVLSQIA